jgi:dienelactone hydrolase
MQHDTLSYEADGLGMVSRLFLGAGDGPRAGVLVFPDLFGIGEHSIERAERLASMGYAALACDLHGSGTTLTDFSAAMEELRALAAQPDRIRARAAGALAALTARPEVDGGRIGAIGFCFGGTIALELARSGADVKAVVGFHSDLATAAPPTAAGGIRSRILACIGADDPLIPAEQRLGFEKEMGTAGADWQMHLYGGVVHNFTNPRSAAMNMPEAVRYDAYADKHSWTLMQALFEDALGGIA